MNLKSKLGMLVLFFVVMFSANVSAQQISVDSPIIKACEETADALKRANIENASLKEQLRLKDDSISLEKERTANAREQSNFWEKASKTGDKIDTTSQQVVFQLRQQVADDRLRISELESENKGLRSSRNWRTAIGFAAGFGTGYYIKSK